MNAGRLRELAVVFLKLGTIGFGGPAAHIALMEDEVVRRRRWITREAFLDLVGATNLIPGPNSTELAIHLGRLRAGVPGLLVAGAAFILPAFVIVCAVAWAYVRAGRLPAVMMVFRGVTPVMLAIVGQALIGLARTAIRSRLLAMAAVLAFVAALMRPLNELAILFAVGLGVGLIRWIRAGGGRIGGVAAFTLSGLIAPTAPGLVPVPVSLTTLFLVFLKPGALLFGSGYVLLAFLRADLVERLGWLTSAQLVDAIVVGQVTPGPVFTTATFIGYVLGGLKGATIATAGIFLPAFVFVWISAPLIPAIRRSPLAGAMLDGVNVASLALMAAVTVTLARSTLLTPMAVAIAVASLILLVRFRLSPTLLIAAAAVVARFTR
jgi:chromate transporter, chromate ion transporter (CHR) family